jgi:ATP-dependent helicase/nuclease subunit A
LLDEFQDTSLLQWDILGTLAKDLLQEGVDNPAVDLRPSVFIVGDAKQSIYGFREAAPEVMDLAAEAVREYGAHVVHLEESYRTAQVVLNAVNTVFQAQSNNFPTHTTARLDGEAVVPNHGAVRMFSSTHSGDESPIECEAKMVARVLKQILKGDWPHRVWDRKQSRWRDLKASDCAILYRSSTDSQAFIDALSEFDIPSIREEQHGYFERNEIQDITSLLRIIAWPGDLLSWTVFLRSPLVGVEEVWLNATLMDASGDTTDRASHLANCLSSKYPDVWQKLQELYALRELPHGIALRAYSLFQVKGAYNHSDFERQLVSSNLANLIDLLRDVELKAEHPSLELVLEELTRLKNKDNIGSAVRGVNAVRLMTIHKSKGLEFPLVFLVDGGSNWFKTDKYWLRSIQRRGMYYLGTSEDQPRGHREFDHYG